MSETATWLAEERHRLDLSSAELANRLGVTSSTVERWERGAPVAYPPLLRAALDALARPGGTPSAAVGRRRENEASTRHGITWPLWRAGGCH